MWTFLPSPYRYIVPIIGIPFNFFMVMVFFQCIQWVWEGSFEAPFDWQIARTICFVLFIFFGFVNAMLYYTEDFTK